MSLEPTLWLKLALELPVDASTPWRDPRSIGNKPHHGSLPHINPPILDLYEYPNVSSHPCLPWMPQNITAMQGHETCFYGVSYVLSTTGKILGVWKLSNEIKEGRSKERIYDKIFAFVCNLVISSDKDKTSQSRTQLRFICLF